MPTSVTMRDEAPTSRPEAGADAAAAPGQAAVEPSGVQPGGGELAQPDREVAEADTAGDALGPIAPPAVELTETGEVPAPAADRELAATPAAGRGAVDGLPAGPPRAAGEERRAVVLRPPSFGAIEARGLVKFYGTTAALRGCDLMVLRGERVALLGANGAGKTTLLKLLATLARPSAGHLTLLGFDAVRQATAVRRQIGVVAHETYLYRDLTAVENLRLYGRLYGVADLAAHIESELERVGLAGLGARRVGTLSRGQQQRLALARALLHQPALLLLDEPDTGLDEAGQALLAAIVRDAAPTVVLTTHSLERALVLADRVVVLAAGKVAYEAASAGLDVARLRAALGGAP